jgi:hypothetical protein
VDYIGLTEKEKHGLLIENALYGLHTAIPASVVSVDLKNQRLSAQIAVNKIVNVSGEETDLKHPVYPGIPFLTLQNADFMLTMPPKPGDACLLIVSERNADEFWKNGTVSAPAYARTRRHDLNDTVAICGFNPRSKLISDYFPDGIEMRNSTKDTFLRLMKNHIEAHLNNPEGVFLVDVTANSRIEATKDAVVESVGADVFSRMDDEKTVTQVGEEVKIECNKNKTVTIFVGETKITIADGAITIDGNPALTINSNDITFNCSNFTVNAHDAVNIKASPLNIVATTHITGDTDIGGNVDITGPTVNITAQTKINGNTNIKGAVNVAGDLDAQLFKKKTPDLRRTADEPTHGILTTGGLYPWDDFLNRRSYDSGDVHFFIQMGYTKIEFLISNEDMTSQDAKRWQYVWLANTISAIMESTGTETGTCEYFVDDYDYERLRFTTLEAGKEAGFITYLQDVTSDADATQGVLTCGSITGSWNDFVGSLGNLGLAFKIVTDGKTVKYLVEYSEISDLDGFEALAATFNDDYDDLSVAFIVTQSTSQFVFTTKGTGKLDGTIDYMQATDTPASAAELISGNFSLSYKQFVDTLAGKDWAAYLNVNGVSCTLLRFNDDIVNDGSFENFFAALVSGKALTVKTDATSVIFSTRSVGHDATLDFPTDTGVLPGEPASLTTGQLLDFFAVRQIYGPGTINITFFLIANSTRYNYVITPENLNSASGWADLINYFSSSSSDIAVTYSVDRYVFTYHEIGFRDFGELQYDGDGQTTIDGAQLLMGEAPFAIINNGSNPDSNVCPNSVELLSLSKATGATVKNGEDVGYRTDSAVILKGTSASGAKAVSGVDGTITMKNNSGTLLKGTKETDANLEVGLDAGEDPPTEFDGIFTLQGKLEVIEEITCKKITSSQGADITGVITLTPRTVPVDEDATPQVTDVIIDGGLKTTTITVLEGGSFGKSVFNDGIEVNGDIKIDNGEISSNGITISFGWGLSVNAEISANDFVW